MPTFEVFLVRLVWIASHVLVLMEIDCAKILYRWFTAYICLSCAVAVFYWPEALPGWEYAFAGLLVFVMILRTLACLESLHYQTCDFIWWSRMMAGAFLFAGFVIVCLSLVRDRQWAGLAVEYRRLLQIWVMIVMAIVELLMLTVGWWRSRRSDWHAFAMSALSGNHARVSLMAMAVHPTGVAWKEANWISVLVDSVVLVVWTFASQTAQSEILCPHRGPSSQPISTQDA